MEEEGGRERGGIVLERGEERGEKGERDSERRCVGEGKRGKHGGEGEGKR